MISGTLIILLILLVLAIPLPIFLGIIDLEPLAVALFLVFGIIALSWASAYGISAMNTYETVQKMSAFREATMSSYEYTINETRDIVINTDNTRDGSITDFTYNEQGKTVSERIKELRDQVEIHNYLIAKYRGWNNNWILSGMYYDIPDDWTYLILGEE